MPVATVGLERGSGVGERLGVEHDDIGAQAQLELARSERPTISVGRPLSRYTASSGVSRPVSRTMKRQNREAHV